MNIYSLGDSHPEVKWLQRALNEKLDRDLKPDGHLGKITQAALLEFQKSQGFVERDEEGACYGQRSQACLGPYIQARFLQESDYEQAAQRLGLSVAHIKAVTQVEAKEAGFLNNGFPVILFERHKFFSFVAKYKGRDEADRLCVKASDVCNPVAGGYLGGMDELGRYQKAAKLDAEGAAWSCSWGMYQVMGFNHRACGFESARVLMEFAKVSERNQLEIFCRFVLSEGATVHKALKAKDWAKVAEYYNGKAYAKNRYDEKLKAAYAQFGGR